MSGLNVFPRSEIGGICEAIKEAGFILVSTNGVFDLLHIGHIQILEKAKAFGDFLLVGVNSDSSARQLDKGKGRPLIEEESRAKIIAALEMVDYVTIFSEKTPIELLEVVKPSIHVKGGDYDLETLPEREVVEKYGGRVELIPFEASISTSEIIERAFQAYFRQTMDKFNAPDLSPEAIKTRRFHLPISNGDQIELKHIEIPFGAGKGRSSHLGPRCVDVLRPKDGAEEISLRSEQKYILGTLVEVSEEFKKALESQVIQWKLDGLTFAEISDQVIRWIRENNITIERDGEEFLICELWTESDPSTIPSYKDFWSSMPQIRFKAEKVWKS